AEEDGHWSPPTRVIVLNKIDRLRDNRELLVWQQRLPEAIALCSLPAVDDQERPGQAKLARRIRRLAEGDVGDVTLRVPLSNPKAINLIETQTTVRDRQYEDGVLVVNADMSDRLLRQLRSLGVETPGRGEVQRAAEDRARSRKTCHEPALSPSRMGWRGASPCAPGVRASVPLNPCETRLMDPRASLACAQVRGRPARLGTHAGKQPARKECAMRTAALSVSLLFATAASAQGLLDPFAAEVIEYSPGADVPMGFDDPMSALGEPARFTGVGSFPGAVTPFNPAFLSSEVVTIGAGGSLTLRLGTPAIDAATNPFGVDLIIFHNGGYIDAAFPAGVVGGTFFDGGSIGVSEDGVEFFAVTMPAESDFPTLGYLDLPTPFTDVPGDVSSDFRLPVDPTIDPDGLDWDQLVDAYDGSGGGIGIDIGTVGLFEVNF
ncbi:GTPase HflX (GTP-binding protein HflX), partial [Durusdinium trenchii]